MNIAYILRDIIGKMKEVVIKPKISEEVRGELSFLPEVVANLLFQRGVLKREEAEAFLDPKYSPHDPFLMKDMERAVRRILDAILKNEKVFIFSDYDADGIPGGVVLNDLFKKIGFNNFDIYIPNRDSEGFGLNDGAVKEMADKGASLIVTVDCGTGDYLEIEEANKLGMDVVVTDHHLVNGELPKAFAVLNPKQKDCSYPEKMLCGAGVAFKLVEGFLKIFREEFDSKFKDKNFFLPPIGWEKWLLDMVALATLSDMVPLLGENRMFAKYGLLVMKKSPRVGLGALYAVSGIKRNLLTEDDIGFSITPRINSASRMGDPKDAFKLLSTEDEGQAIILASNLDALNKKRKTVVASMSREIKSVIKERGLAQKEVVALGNPNWKPSLLGLVAGNLAEEFGRPVFIWGRDGKNYKGSCRGYGDVGVIEIMNLTEGLFKEFGGHEMAGGFLVFEEKIYDFSNYLEEAFSKAKISQKAEKSLEADMSILIDEIDEIVLENIKRLAPFGEGNPKPIFLIRSAKTCSIRRFGANKNHLALSLQSGDSRIDAVSFFFGGNALPEEGGETSVLVNLEEDNFYGSGKMRLRIVDIV